MNSNQSNSANVEIISLKSSDYYELDAGDIPRLDVRCVLPWSMRTGFVNVGLEGEWPHGC